MVLNTAAERNDPVVMSGYMQHRSALVFWWVALSVLVGGAQCFGGLAWAPNEVGMGDSDRAGW